MEDRDVGPLAVKEGSLKGWELLRELQDRQNQRGDEGSRQESACRGKKRAGSFMAGAMH